MFSLTFGIKTLKRKEMEVERKLLGKSKGTYKRGERVRGRSGALI